MKSSTVYAIRDVVATALLVGGIVYIFGIAVTIVQHELPPCKAQQEVAQ
jgi:hypothetical protein